ncbi:MAG: prepilin-type N-terminal cleavage/methylation domain-containing protein [Candidatus Daviesbacteria bacterium]|nr:prepilin-type N-terminal cleavage/methylation domain-containing protein [Candidatus Daviesbacteria bacterium]
MRKSAYGFTLVELLVVIAVMALISTVVLANYRSFGEDQKLKNAVLDIQSQLRSAQTNATTNIKCKTKTADYWRISIFGQTDIRLRCIEFNPFPNIVDKKLTLDPNIQIDSVSGNPAAFCPSVLSFDITFAPLTGKITLGSTTNCTSLTVTLKNTKTGNTKSLVIEQGGRIYAQ